MPAETQPRIQAGDLTYLGSFTLPPRDGSAGASPNGDLVYGGVAGMGADGTSLYYIGNTSTNQLARINIPAIGGTATVARVCRWMPLSSFDTPPSASQAGNALVWNGRLYVTGYVFYDASGPSTSCVYSFNTDIEDRQGPYQIQWGGGLVGQYLCVIPPEWQSLLGGPVAAGASALNIITRSSSGPAFFSFDPANIGPVTCPSNRLLAYQIPNNTYTPFSLADVYGGMAIPSGFRSVLYIRRHGDVTCYGTGAECGDPTDGSKGQHAYPYRHEVIAYDLNDLAAVYAGTTLPWEVQPYATWTLSDMLPFSGGVGYARMKSSVYDPATRRWYITAFSGSTTYGPPRVHVYQIAAASGPVDCAGTWSAWAPTEDWGPCVAGEQSRQESRTFTIGTPPSGGGAACPTSPEFRTVTQDCGAGARGGMVICG